MHIISSVLHQYLFSGSETLLSSMIPLLPVLELQVYLLQVLHLLKMSIIDGSPSTFLSLLTSERGSIHPVG